LRRLGARRGGALLRFQFGDGVVQRGRQQRGLHAAALNLPPCGARGGHELHHGERDHRDQRRHDRGQAEERVGGWRQNSPRYQASALCPTVAAAAAPSARNVPNGSAYFMPPRLLTIRASPTTEPASEAIISVTSASFQPRNAPIIASIFTSPIPSPSSWRTR